jgi:trigger factor
MAESEAHDTTVAEDKPPQQVTVEDVGPARKKLTIEIPESRIKEKFDSDFQELAQEAQVPGFRKGKAPAKLLERRFGDALRRQVKGELLNAAYSQAIEDEGLDVLGEPDIDVDNIELPESGDLTFDVEVEVRPDFELPDFSQLEVHKQPAAVTDEDVESEISQYQERFGEMATVEGAQVQEGDFIQGDVTILQGEDAGDDAEQLEHHPGTYVLVNGEQMDYKGHVAGIVVEDLGKRLPGKKEGDVERVSMTGPESHQNEQIANQPITITIRIDQIQRMEPAPVSTVVEQAGMETEEELRERIKEMLQQRKQNDQTQDAHRQLREQLREKIEVELPEHLVSKQAEQVTQQKQMEMLYSGGISDPQQLDEKLQEVQGEAEGEAREQVKDHFIIDKAANELSIEVSENELNQQIYMQAMQQGRRPEKMRQELQQKGELQQMYMQLRERKTLDQIMEQATVHEPEGEAPASEEAEGQSE